MCRGAVAAAWQNVAMRRALSVFLAALALSACKVDTQVAVVVEADGSGTITVTATADADVVGQAPGLADDLRFDDAVAAGWEVDGPTATDTGGLTVSLQHDFAAVEEATALLRSINGDRGPLHDVAITRVVTKDDITTSLSGTMRVDGGLDAFADPDVLAAIGGTPYADDVAAAGLRPTDAVTVVFTADLPGDVLTTDTTAEAPTTWTVPLDGTAADLTTSAVLAQGESDSVWGTVADVALVALVAWCVVAVAFIAFVAAARRKRAHRRAPAAR